MIGLDTNLLVRCTMQYDAKQSRKAARLRESLTVEEPGFVSLVAVVELGRVLSSANDLDRKQVAQALELMMRTKTVVVDRADEVVKALCALRQRAGLATGPLR